jgi:riboflavin biosynthesis pyrimidine reductase
LIKELSDQSVNHIYVDGGIVIQEFLLARLVDEITVTIVPILIGKGKSFSRLLSEDLYLHHLKTTVLGLFKVNTRLINRKKDQILKIIY